ncbi:hypothetical protein NS365_22855 [Aureimonas ureilytica]|uniref:Uncharacterized protein n=1 Tax=Aureimonas ureilytica TaxID=401562 RepID=A0A175RE83_9HYPH|nr:hypothetical protein NS365_22855 [Aureimonas ureilytica]
MVWLTRPPCPEAREWTLVRALAEPKSSPVVPSTSVKTPIWALSCWCLSPVAVLGLIPVEANWDEPLPL